MNFLLQVIAHMRDIQAVLEKQRQKKEAKEKSKDAISIDST